MRAMISKNGVEKFLVAVFVVIALAALGVIVALIQGKSDLHVEIQRADTQDTFSPNTGAMDGAPPQPIPDGAEVTASGFAAPFTTTRDGWTFYEDPEGGMTLFGWEWVSPITKDEWFTFEPLTAEYSLENVPMGQVPGGIYKGDLIEGFEIVRIRQDNIDFIYPSGNPGSWKVAILETTGPSFVVAMYLESEFNRTFCANTRNGPRPVTPLREMNTEYDSWDAHLIRAAEIIGIPPCLDS